MIGERTVPELALTVVTKSIKLVVRRLDIGGFRTRSDGFTQQIGQRTHPNRRYAVDGRVVAELPISIVTGRPNSPIGFEKHREPVAASHA